MSYMPVRGGTRGGKDQFQWDDVKVDKHRENYLGHSVMAPVGRWQKGKDLSWYNKKSKVMGQKEILKAEIAAVKRAEEEAMAAALGLKPKVSSLGSGSVSKQELAEVCRRQSVEEKEETGEERMKGLGFIGHRLAHRHSSSTGTDMFESDPFHERDSGRIEAVSISSHQPAASPPPSSHPPPPKHARLHRELVRVERASDASPAHRSKETKKKTKKDKSKKKHKRERKRRHHSSASESEEETGRGRRQRKGHVSSDMEDGRESRTRRHKGHGSNDSEEKRQRKGDSNGGANGRREKTHHSNARENVRRKETASESEDESSRGRRQRQHGRDKEKSMNEPHRSRHRRHDSSSD